MTTVISPRLANVLQVVASQTGAVATGTTQIPFDDTVPQNTEGDQYLSVTITPKSATSTLIITTVLLCSATTNNQITLGLFQDSTAGAIAVSSHYLATTSGVLDAIALQHTMTSGTTSATTFKIRAGLSGAGTITVNGTSSARKFGGVSASSIVVTEVL